MFSCCCGRLPGSFRAIPGCDCFKSSYTCSAACLTEVCGSWQDSYYRMAQEIVGHLMHLHPKANIWLVGHSLGGALAGTTATAYGIPAFAFEAPGDALFASRLGLVPRFSDPDYIPRMRASHVFHWGNTGDPIFLGVCNGISSSCYMSGYALESKCHIGRTCTFDLDRIGDPVEPPPDAPGDGDGSGGPSEPGSPDPADPSPPDCGKRWWWPYPKPNCTDTPEPTPEPAPTPEPEPEPEEPCKEWWWWPWPSCNDTVPATTGTAKMAVATPAPDSRTTQKASKPKPTMEDYRRRALARLRRQELSPRPADVDTNAFVSIQKHRMNYLIYDVMLKWSGPLPECVVEEGCEECTGWSFVK